MPISPTIRNSRRTFIPLLGLPLLCLGILRCGGDGGPNPTGAINLSPSTIAFATTPGGSVNQKTVGITPATVNLTGLTVSSAYTGTPPSQWLGATLSGSTATLAAPAIVTLSVTNSNLPAGTYKATVTVSSKDAVNSPTVSVTLTIEAPSALGITTQPSATAASGAVLAQAPVVQLQTANGDPVGQSGIDVTVAVEGGGTLGGPVTSTTDAQGKATFNGLSVTALIGEHTLLFTAPGLDEVRSNSIAITVGAAAQITASSVTSQSAEAGTLVNEPPIALITDEAGNPVEGIPVIFAVTQGGGVINPTTTVATGADGLASSTSWTLGSVAGDNAATATSTGLQGSPVGFSATGTNGGVVPGTISGTNSSVAASPISFAAGSSGTTITVTARDASNNLIGGANVTLASTGTNFNFVSTTLTTGVNGTALGKATTTYTSTTAETKSISAQITASGVTVSPAAAAVTVVAGAPSAATSTVAASTPAPGLANSSTVTITVKDANNNPVGGRSVTLGFVGGVTGGSILGPFSTTNSSGVTTASLASTTGGSYQVQATVSGGPTITQQPTVVFLLSFAGDIQQGIFDTPFADGLGGMTTPCKSCHLPDGGSMPNLSFTEITKPHDLGFVVVPGDAANSLLIKALLHDPSLNPDMSEFMPSSTQFLPPDVIAKIRLWINQNGGQGLTP